MPSNTEDSDSRQAEKTRKHRELVERLRREESVAFDKETLTDSDLLNLKILSSEIKRSADSKGDWKGESDRVERRRHAHTHMGGSEDSPVIEIKKIHIGLVAAMQLAGWVIGYLISVNALQMEVTAMKKDIDRQQNSSTLVIDKLSRMETDIKWIIQEQGRLSVERDDGIRAGRKRSN